MIHCFAARTAAVLLACSSLAVAQWLQRTPATQPTARTGSGMDFVPANLGLVLFGGGAPFINAETWVYDGSTWAQLTPATSPTARFGHQLVYDSSRGVAVLYGGLASNISIPPPASDTWEWNGSTWTLAAPTANAGPRYRYGACFDSIRGRVVMYGGATSQLLMPPNAQTWEYNGTTWQQIATVGNPGGRDRPAMCFFAAIGRTVMFGGYDGNTMSDQTWLYDGIAGTWTQVATANPKPPARSSAAMTFDATRNLCVLNGGQTSSGAVLSDTWTFDGVKWTEQPTATQGVRDHVLGFLPTTNQVVKFGGFVSAPSTLSNQTWELGSGIYGAGCLGTNGVPSLAATTAPRLGQPWTLNFANLNPAFNLAFLALGFTQLPGLDLGPVLGMPGCAAFTTGDILLGVSGAGGTASWTWPAVAGPLGGAFFGQSLCFDPGVNAFGFTITNAVYATITN